ncbi:MAG: topoisomerase DNA-binding C4 zinc finger domain-containing protein, partial [Acutalibacteraceae bacterium]|nr:topoisomerase DNA-binding C4 zinc finger domain-containing protein [Acutalibacteraceae bacterium]
VESELDDVESGDVEWKKMLAKFYKGFDKTLTSAEEKMDGERVKVPEEVSDVVCEKCGRNMVIRSGRFGKFLACPGFPECKNTKPIVTETPGLCPKCSSKILLRKSSKGNKYFACEKGKECGFMTWDTPTDKTCPDCGKTLFKRRGGITLCLDEKCGYQKQSTRRSKAKENKSDE